MMSLFTGAYDAMLHISGPSLPLSYPLAPIFDFAYVIAVYFLPIAQLVPEYLHHTRIILLKFQRRRMNRSVIMLYMLEHP